MYRKKMYSTLDIWQLSKVRTIPQPEAGKVNLKFNIRTHGMLKFLTRPSCKANNHDVWLWTTSNILLFSLRFEIQFVELRVNDKYNINTNNIPRLKLSCMVVLFRDSWVFLVVRLPYFEWMKMPTICGRSKLRHTSPTSLVSHVWEMRKPSYHRGVTFSII